jgi:hypothetical protein
VSTSALDQRPTAPHQTISTFAISHIPSHNSTASTELIRIYPGSQPQKGIISYGLSSNRQNAFAGAFHDAIFNTARRTNAQWLYWVPTFLSAYYALNWATER